MPNIALDMNKVQYLEPAGVDDFRWTGAAVH